MNDYWISPSSFAWLWRDCRRCWWLQMTQSTYQPRSGMPPIVERVDRLSMQALEGMDLTCVGVPGVVVATEQRVKAKTRELHGVHLTVGGRLDLLVQLHDGGTALVDVKFTMPKAEETANAYRLQTSAYAWALGDPASGEQVKVTQTGLLCIRPLAMLQPQACGIQAVALDTGEVLYDTYPDKGQLDPVEDPESALVLSWLYLPQAHNAVELATDYQRLEETLGEMAAILAAGKPPKSAPGCTYCNYVRRQNELAVKLRAAAAEETKP
jgi:CRISPR/Cas system-associated exonuclease Cas4 (RecB family)